MPSGKSLTEPMMFQFKDSLCHEADAVTTQQLSRASWSIAQYGTYV